MAPFLKILLPIDFSEYSVVFCSARLRPEYCMTQAVPSGQARNLRRGRVRISQSSDTLELEREANVCVITP